MSTNDDLKGRELWEFVFDPTRERPHKEALHQYKKRPGWFPTRKGPLGCNLLRTRDNIVHDFMYYAETDFDVVQIVDHPFQTLYWAEDGDGESTRPHIADLALGHRDGSITFVDVRRFWEIDTTPRARDRAFRRAAHYLERHGSRYILHDERKIYPEPLFTNVKGMCELARPHARLPGYGLVRDEILDMPLPMTVHQIMQASAFNTVTERFADEPADAARILSEINPVFEVVMELVAFGDLWIDESKPFTIGSPVHRTEFTGLRRDRDFVRSFLAPEWEDGRKAS